MKQITEQPVFKHLSFATLPAADQLQFVLPPELEAGEPPEARGLARDEVRLMMSYGTDDRVVHSRFRALPEFLAPGDLLVINTSGTLNAALEATRAELGRLHAQAKEAVEATHRQYRRDLVPVRQTVTLYRDQHPR